MCSPDHFAARLRELEADKQRLQAEVDRLTALLEPAEGGGPVATADRHGAQAAHCLPLSILDNMPAMIGYWDTELHNCFCNQAYSTWFGLEPAQITGRHIREVIGEERYQLNLPYIQAALRGEAQSFERAIPSPDGKVVRNALAEYVPDVVDGCVRGFFVQVSDISSVKQAQLNLRANEEKLRGLFELSPLGIALTDMNGRFLEFNEAFRKLCGYDADQLKGLDYWQLTPEKYAAEEARQLDALARSGRYGPYEKEYRRHDGSLVPVRLNGVQVVGADGERYIWSIVEDISESRRIEADRRVAASAFEAQVGIMVTDSEGRIVKVNRALLEASGYAMDELLGQTPRLFKSGRHDAAFYVAMWQSLRQAGVWQGELWDRRKDGEVYPKWVTITAVKGESGETTHFVSTQIDISERKAAEQEIENLAFYDPLTALPNRRLLRDRLQHALAVSVRGQRYGALLFIDLDNFKTLNDTLGHPAGDSLLQEVACRLASCVREGDTVARLGGDEFVVMLEGLAMHLDEAADQAKGVGDKILAALKEPYQLGEHKCHSTSSIGVALFGNQRDSMDEVLKQADMAMYKAKAAGRDALCFFDPAMEASLLKRALLETDLRRALEEKQFLLHYQAQISGADRLTGAEVLLRWQHPVHGMVSPADFIPLAEETRLIVPLGQWVLETACRQLAAWASRLEMAHLTIAVNVSAHQLRLPDFVARVLAVIEQTGANPLRLKLELTESLLVHNVEEVIGKMSELKAAGVGFSLDDFGTGYSSLTYLKRLPLDELKIDQSFVRDVLVDPNDAAIARTVVALARSLGLGVIAEGVETAAQRDFLAASGCHAYQGYFFSRPLPVEQFVAFAEKFAAELEESSP